LLYERDEATGQGVHLYDDMMDDRDCVMLSVEGFTFETSVSVALSGRLETRVLLRIPKRWARKLGLLKSRPDAVTATPDAAKDE
jgi:hypothetical protein